MAVAPCRDVLYQFLIEAVSLAVAAGWSACSSAREPRGGWRRSSPALVDLGGGDGRDLAAAGLAGVIAGF